MKRFTGFCLGLAIVIGGSANAAFSCGGAGGATGCKVAALPLAFDVVVSFIHWLGVVIP